MKLIELAKNKRQELLDEIAWHDRIHDVFELNDMYQTMLDELDDLMRDSFLMGIDADRFNRLTKALETRTYAHKRVRKVSEN